MKRLHASQNNMYHFIVNPNSRSGKGIEIWKIIEHELHKNNISYELHLTKRIHHATEIAEEISLENNSNIIVTLGGDGTVNEVINGITDYNKITLAYIPTGSSNDFARSLGLSDNPLTALNQILHPKKHVYLDVGTLTGGNGTTRKFAVSCGIGFDAAVCEEVLKTPLKKVFNKIGLGKLIYAIIALKQIFGCKTAVGTLILDHTQKIQLSKLYFISSHIHKYEGGGLKLCPDALPDDGLLDLCVVSGLSRLKIFLLLPTAFLGLHTSLKGVHIYRCKEAELVVDTPLFVHTDGEVVFEESKIKVSTNKMQLRVIVK